MKIPVIAVIVAVSFWAEHFSVYVVEDASPVREISVPVVVCIAAVMVLSLAIMVPQLFGRKP